MKRSKFASLLVFVLVSLGMCLPAGAQEAAAKQKKKRRPNPALVQIGDQPGLPRVLLIGDSISIGYTVPVRELLKGKANVHRPNANCGPTTRGLEQIDQWLGDKPWDVIHFNWGLHDLKYMNKGKGLADPKAPGANQQVPPEDYRKNLTKLVERLQKTKARLIWCSTTPVPAGSAGRIKGDAAKYNKIAADVMKRHTIPTNDLHAFCMPKLAELQRPANVHFTPGGSKALAKQVAGKILEALED